MVYLLMPETTRSTLNMFFFFFSEFKRVQRNFLLSFNILFVLILLRMSFHSAWDSNVKFPFKGIIPMWKSMTMQHRKKLGHKNRETGVKWFSSVLMLVRVEPYSIDFLQKGKKSLFFSRKKDTIFVIAKSYLTIPFRKD